MRALALARSVPRTLATRGVTLWVLIRMLIGALFLLLRTTGADSPHPNPVVVVVICAIVGIVDLRRRGEAMLWANLGVSSTQLVILFVVTAMIGETMLAVTFS